MNGGVCVRVGWGAGGLGSVPPNHTEASYFEIFESLLFSFGLAKDTTQTW